MCERHVCGCSFVAVSCRHARPFTVVPAAGGNRPEHSCRVDRTVHQCRGRALSAASPPRVLCREGIHGATKPGINARAYDRKKEHECPSFALPIFHLQSRCSHHRDLFHTFLRNLPGQDRMSNRGTQARRRIRTPNRSNDAKTPRTPRNAMNSHVLLALGDSWQFIGFVQVRLSTPPSKPSRLHAGNLRQ